MIDTAPSIRLNRYISDSGYCSRREADRLIEAGRVTLNGTRAVLGAQVKAEDLVLVQGQRISVQLPEKRVYIALNKPVGIECTTDTTVRNNIVDFVGHSERIFPIGRLDKDSQGLILMTNDGEIVNKILRAANRHEKEYIVTVNKPITPGFLEGMANGVPILDVITQKCRVRKLKPTVFNIVLTQGLNRQIRRMCEYFGYDVVRLERIRIMHMGLRGLPVGAWRNLDAQELKVLLQSVQTSQSAPVGAKHASPLHRAGSTLTPAARPARPSTSPRRGRSGAAASPPGG